MLKAVVLGSLAGLVVVEGFTGPAGVLPSSTNRHASCTTVMAAEPVSRRAAVLTTLLGVPLFATKSAEAAGLNIIPPALRDASKGGKREVELSLEEQYPDEPAPVPKAEARKKAREEAKKAAEEAKKAKAAAKASPDPPTAAKAAPAPKKKVVEEPIESPQVVADDKEYKVRKQQVAGATGKEKFETSTTMSLEEKLKKRAAAKLDAQYDSLKSSAPVRDEKTPSLIPGK